MFWKTRPCTFVEKHTCCSSSRTRRWAARLATPRVWRGSTSSNRWRLGGVATGPGTLAGPRPARGCVMASKANRMGSLSADAYIQPGTITSSNKALYTQTAKPNPGGGTMDNDPKQPLWYDPYDALNNNLTQKKNFTTKPAPPRAPNYWRYGRDLYRQAGMPGESYLDNVNGPASVTKTTTGGPAVLTGATYVPSRVGVETQGFTPATGPPPKAAAAAPPPLPRPAAPPPPE